LFGENSVTYDECIQLFYFHFWKSTFRKGGAKKLRMSDHKRSERKWNEYFYLLWYYLEQCALL
jgi:hypothetical protein